jgi:DNA-binding NarL/FixJ family response regulator
MSGADSGIQPAVRKSGRVLIVEDDRLVALDLETMLADFGLAACPTAHSAEEALRNARAYLPDLVLMDIRLEGEVDGVRAAQLLHDELGLRVVYLTANSDLSTVERAKQTQPYGYLLKPIRPLDLRCCLELALHQVQLGRAEAGPTDSSMLHGLSAREVEVLTLIARGHTSKDIAHALNIAKPTVDTYRGRLTDKLGIKSRAELVSFATSAGLLGSLTPPARRRSD